MHRKENCNKSNNIHIYIYIDISTNEVVNESQIGEVSNFLTMEK